MAEGWWLWVKTVMILLRQQRDKLLPCRTGFARSLQPSQRALPLAGLGAATLWDKHKKLNKT
jgi:hypothetical protein